MLPTTFPASLPLFIQQIVILTILNNIQHIFIKGLHATYSSPHVIHSEETKASPSMSFNFWNLEGDINNTQ